MISEKIKKHNISLKERGIPHDSHFTLHFHDTSSICETECNWSDMSEKRECEYFGGKKTVFVSIHPIKKIHVKHGGLEHLLEVPEDCEVYQAIRSDTLFLPDQEKRVRILGRVVGLVKDGKILEEYFLNGIHNEVIGQKSI